MSKKKVSEMPKTPAESEMRMEACCEFIKENTMKIAEIADQIFEQSMDEAKEIIFDFVRDVMEKEPIHYTWQPDGCPWDSSGEVKEDGYIPFDITIQELLEEYNGQKSPSFTSGMGWLWNRLSDDLDEYVRDYSWQIMYECIENYVNENAHIEGLTDQEMNEAILDSYDDIYDNCYALDLSCAEGMIDRLEAGSIRVSDICDRDAYEEAVKKIEKSKQDRYAAVRRTFLKNQPSDTILERFLDFETKHSKLNNEEIIEFIAADNARMLTMMDIETGSLPLDIQKQCFEFWVYVTDKYEGLYEACMDEWIIGPLVGRIAADYYQKYIESTADTDDIAKENYS